MDANDPNNHHKGCCKPEIGRGCAFCEGCCSTEPEAHLREGCFKLHETPWLEGYPDNFPTDIFEVRFKNTRRGFYQNVNDLSLKRGDIVAVEASPGHDIGIVSLTGDLVAKQMRRTGFNPFNGEFKKIYRKAKPYDIERWQEAIALEQETMIHARQIAAEMGLNMKIGDVEYQGDKIKAIFYYIADERVDFRELIKVFAERFHIRIEMKQIGARQEAGRIGGLGACGRELCCASWISSFTSVTTGAARTQDLSLNPQKLAGQCSKLKCCLMYEYDAYADARKEFPRLREPLQTLDGEYFAVKNDILSGTMTFSTSKDSLSNAVTLPIARVKEIIALNRAGKKPDRLQEAGALPEVPDEPTYRSEEDSITRFDQAKRRSKNRRGKGRNADGGGQPQQGRRAEEKPGKPQSRKENGREQRSGDTDRSNDKTAREGRPSRENGGGADNRRRRNEGEGGNRPQRDNAPGAERRPPHSSGEATAERAARSGAAADASGSIAARNAANGGDTADRTPRENREGGERRSSRTKSGRGNGAERNNGSDAARENPNGENRTSRENGREGSENRRSRERTNGGERAAQENTSAAGNRASRPGDGTSDPANRASRPSGGRTRRSNGDGASNRPERNAAAGDRSASRPARETHENGNSGRNDGHGNGTPKTE